MNIGGGTGYLCGVSQVVVVVKSLPASARDIRDLGLIPGLERSPRAGNGNLLQYSCLENSIGRGAWRALGGRGAHSPWGHKESDMTE